VAHVHRKLWRKKPPPSVQLDWSHPLASRFRSVLMFQRTDACHDYVGGFPLNQYTTFGSPRANGESYSLGINYTNGWSARDNVTSKLSTGLTFVCGYRKESSGVYYSPLFRATGGINFRVDGEELWSGVSLSSPVVNKLQSVSNNLVALSIDSFTAGNLYVWAGFGLKSSHTFSGKSKWGNAEYQLLGGNNSAGNGMYADFAYILDGPSSDDQVYALFENPWQIYVPDRRTFYADLGAGGTQDASHVASGGATAGGAATSVRERSSTGSGGATAGGTAQTSKEAGHVASGGAVAGGTAETSSGEATQDASHVASGGAVSAGAAASSRESVVAGQGGATSGGQAAQSREAAATGSGGAASGGAAVASASTAGDSEDAAVATVPGVFMSDITIEVAGVLWLEHTVAGAIH
jgi:hypothetical protein